MISKSVCVDIVLPYINIQSSFITSNLSEPKKTLRYPRISIIKVYWYIFVNTY